VSEEKEGHTGRRNEKVSERKTECGAGEEIVKE
jgi:hypothetical protein